MRRRYQVNLYTEHSKHLDLIEHLMSFDKNKRSSELTMLLLAGYQVLYGKGDTGFDRSTSTLLDEQDQLLSLLLARGRGAGNSGHHQVSAPSVHHQTQEVTRDPSQGRQLERPLPPQEQTFPSQKESTPEGKEAPAKKVETESKKEQSKNEPNNQTNNRHYVNDLTDEDPSINSIPEQDLEEDIVDPLSLLG